jgi:glycosyltransferase involved in cell wall biosynthesis
VVPTVIYTAAHGGFDLTRVPLGGAAAVFHALTREWEKTRPFSLQLLTPEVLGEQAPRDKDLVRYSELRYARFCFDFEAATTRHILQHDPSHVRVLINDISEGPGFQTLAERGYALYTLYHVDVVDYFTRMYLRGVVRPERLTAVYEQIARSPLRAAIPRLLKLVFEKQRDSLRYSRGVIVPSEGMKRVLTRCYPEILPDRIHVIPWGTQPEIIDESAVERRTAELRRQHAIPEQAKVLITLSRVSPEKGQDRLLRALQRWEKSADLPPEGLWAIICGEAAYMKGSAFQKRLHRLAKRLKKVHVLFPGYVAGVDKQAYLRLADLYVFPSRHESYGLTLLEAFHAGLAAVVCSHYGAEELMRPEFGELLPAVPESAIPTLLQSALARLLTDRSRLRRMGAQARTFAESRSFTDTARQVAQLISN